MKRNLLRAGLFPALLLSLALAGCGMRQEMQTGSEKSVRTGDPISSEIEINAEATASTTVSENGEFSEVSMSTATQDRQADGQARESQTGGQTEESQANRQTEESTEETQANGQTEESTEESQAVGQTGTSPQIHIVMVGDILLHTPVEKSAKREDGTYSYDAIFADTKDLISAADLALVNQEVILGGTELGISGYPAFNAPYEVGDDLVEAGFDVICHATNHALDKGKKGVLNCLNFWKTTYPNIQILGLHDNPDDSLYIYEKDGMKIAFLNYTYSTNGVALPEDMPYAVDMLSQKKVTADIQYAESVADFTVVCPHWGTEYRLTPDSYQEKWTKIFLENGVDLVLGTHPHVIEPIELREDDNGHSMLVYYSLGNFVNWTSSSGDGISNRMVGGMADVTLERNDDGNVVLSDYGITALVCHLTDGQDGVSVKLLSDYTEELASQNRIRSQDPAFSLEYCAGLCDEIWGDLWK